MAKTQLEIDPPVAIPPPTKIDTLRTSKLTDIGNGVQSGIDKQPREGSVAVLEGGLTEDEHDYTFHGGPDKAVHQYCSGHYAAWQIMFPDPEVAARFVPGGFGENITAHGWSENTICIGDRVRVGHTGSELTDQEHGALLEVSLPRQPCFKLNQRFGIKNFAPKTLELARTGWYYRVIEPGSMEAGMEVRVVERPYPRWTIERLQHYLHKDKNENIIEELLTIPQMGIEATTNFEKHLTKLRKAREPKPVQVLRDFKIVEKEPDTPKVSRFVLEAVSGSLDPEAVKPGSHVCLHLPNDLSRSYSITSGTADRLEFGILREDNSRGGSSYLHDTAKIGDIIPCGSVTQSLEPAAMASIHLLVAGGIGITAFPAMIACFQDINLAYHLHYAVASEKDIAFKNRLDELKASYTLYDKSKGQRLNIRELLEKRAWNAHVFVCGPQRMIDDVVSSAKAVGMSDDEIHQEAFKAEIGGDPFTADVIGNGEAKKVEVGEEETLLDVIKKAGFDCGSSCEVGNCATCKVGLKAGRVEHRGSALSEKEKETVMLSCVSRGIGHITVELE